MSEAPPRATGAREFANPTHDRAANRAASPAGRSPDGHPAEQFGGRTRCRGSLQAHGESSERNEILEAVEPLRLHQVANGRILDVARS